MHSEPMTSQQYFDDFMHASRYVLPSVHAAAATAAGTATATNTADIPHVLWQFVHQVNQDPRMHAAQLRLQEGRATEQDLAVVTSVMQVQNKCLQQLRRHAMTPMEFRGVCHQLQHLTHALPPA